MTMSGLCEHCIQGHTLEGTPAGSLQGADYFHPSPNPSKRAVVLLTDVFGLNLVNPKLIADEYSKRLECDVWCPDFFAGSPPFAESQLGPLLPDTAGQSTSFLSRLKFVLVVIAALPSIFMNRSSVVDSRITSFVKKIKEEKGYEKVGAIGFCFGGAAVVRLCSTGLFDSGVIAHPGAISMAQVQAINVPTSWICAEEDSFFPKTARNNMEAYLKHKKDVAKGSEFEFRDYKGTAHGFAARPNCGIPEIKKAFEDALDQGAAWFDKTLDIGGNDGVAVDHVARRSASV